MKKSFWSEPYLWIHASGLAVLPLALGVCWLGLAAGDPVFPVWLEYLAIALVGIVPILAMQWFRPFNIFSILLICLRPEVLSEEQRRILSLFKLPSHRLVAAIAPAILSIVLWKIYVWAPMAAAVTPFPPGWRLVGLAVGAIAFGASNLFLQVPISVFRVLLTPETTFATTAPYPVEQIRSDFTNPGLPVRQILPPMKEEWSAKG